jgi:hypothetical protein
VLALLVVTLLLVNNHRQDNHSQQETPMLQRIRSISIIITLPAINLVV